MVEEQKRIDFFDTIIIMIAVICLFIAAIPYLEDEEKFTIHKRFIQSVLDDETHFVINYQMNSTVFSAQNEIYVSILAWPWQDFIEKHQSDVEKTPEIMYIYFLDSNTKLDKFTEDGLFHPTFAIKRGDDGRYRGGPFEIIYQEEGAKCAVLSIDKQRSTQNICNEESPPLVTISSADSKLQYDNNKVILSLTWVIVAFTVIAIRDPLRHIFEKKS